MIGLSHIRGLGSGGASSPAAVLDLDFLSGQTDPRVMYSRSSQASRIDSAGRVSIASHNLCLHSEQFSLGWVRENVSAFGGLALADSGGAPDGTSAGDVIDEGAGNGRHIVYQLRPIPGGGNYAASVFVKDLGRRFMQLLITPSGFTSGGFVMFDLQAGAVTQTKAFVSNAPVLSSSIEPTGDGWFRVSFSFNVLPGITSLYFVVACSDRPGDGGAMAYNNPSYIGSGKKIAVWGAQLELIGRDVGVRAYVRSNALPFYGPRLDHDPSTGARLGLLVEDARTNLILRSDAPSSQTISVSAQPHTISFYGSGSIALSGAASGIVSGAGSGPARRTFTFTPAAGALALAISGDVSFAQCETGTFATSWIPTWNTASLRAADDVRFDAASIGDWLSPSAGTFFVEASRLSAISRGDVLHLRNFSNAALGEVNAYGGAAGSLDVSMRTSAGSFTAAWQDAFVQDSFVSGSPARAAFAYGADGGAISINGSAAVESPGVLGLSQANTMTIGSNVGPARHFLNGHVRRIRHYSKRLSNGLLQRMSA